MKLISIKVYQYTFRMPDDDRGKDPHAVMWDYNVGLVRITSFIKSLGHSKVIPLSLMLQSRQIRLTYPDNASEDHGCKSWT